MSGGIGLRARREDTLAPVGARCKGECRTSRSRARTTSADVARCVSRSTASGPGYDGGPGGNARVLNRTGDALRVSAWIKVSRRGDNSGAGRAARELRPRRQGGGARRASRAGQSRPRRGSTVCGRSRASPRKGRGKCTAGGHEEGERGRTGRGGPMYESPPPPPKAAQRASRIKALGGARRQAAGDAGREGPTKNKKQKPWVRARGGFPEDPPEGFRAKAAESTSGCKRLQGSTSSRGEEPASRRRVRRAWTADSRLFNSGGCPLGNPDSGLGGNDLVYRGRWRGRDRTRWQRETTSRKFTWASILPAPCEDPPASPRHSTRRRPRHDPSRSSKSDNRPARAFDGRAGGRSGGPSRSTHGQRKGSAVVARAPVGLARRRPS